MALKTPLAAQSICQQCFAAAARFAICAVVSPHDGLNFRIHNTILKGGEIGLLHILWRDLGIKTMTKVFRTAVNGKMLGAGGGFHNGTRSLETPDICLSQPGGQIRVFPISLMPSPPAGITEDIDIGRPKGQTFENVPIVFLGIGIIFCPSFRCGSVPQFFQQLIVKHGCQPDRLGKAGGSPGSGYSVERLVPPVIGGNSQTGNCGSVITKLSCLFFQRHLRHKRFGLLYCFCPIHRILLYFSKL